MQWRKEVGAAGLQADQAGYGLGLFSAAPWADLTHTDFLLTVTENIKLLIMEEKLDLLHPCWDLSHFWRRCSSSRSRSRACGCPPGQVYHEWSIMLCSEHPPPCLSSLTPSFPAPFHVGRWEPWLLCGSKTGRGLVPSSASSSAWGAW